MMNNSSDVETPGQNALENVPNQETGHPLKTKEPVKCLSFKWIKKKAKAIKKEITAVYYAMLDPRTPFYAKILPCLAILYAISPVDLVPDFIPVLGLLDDIVIVPLLLWLGIKLIPKDVMEEARTRAKAEPFKLSKNWLPALGMLLVWLIVVEAVVYKASSGHRLTWLFMLLAGVVVTALFGSLAYSEHRKMVEKAAKEARKTQQNGGTADGTNDKDTANEHQQATEHDRLLSS